MQDIHITVTTLLAVFGGISVIGGGVTMIYKLFTPARKVSKTVTDHARMLDNDNRRLQELESTNRMICKSLLVLLDHEITGNSVDKLKEAKKEMQDFLISR